MSEPAIVVQNIEEIQLPELKSGLKDKSIILVDVREPDEWAAGRIPGAIFNPLSKFDAAKLPAVPGKRVVLYCRSGRRTQIALAQAQAAGRTDVKAHFKAGMLGWQAAGEPIEK